jgi:hypothetical protein
MSLLREIQDAAVDVSTPLAVVLRKCMILAARLGHEPFKKWVDEELNGYLPDADLPAYRRIDGLTSIGSFAGPFGGQLRNVPLATAPIPAHLRDQYTHAEFREGVAKLADLVKKGEGILLSRWPGDLIYDVADKYYKGYALLTAHIEIPKSAVVGVLDAIRNKVLKFALEIEQQNPAAGEVLPGTTPVPEEKVGQIFNTYIMGGAQNVAVGSPGAVQHAQQLQPGDLAGLGTTPRWVEHPRGQAVDVVAVPLHLAGRARIHPLDLGLADSDVAVQAAMPVSIIGYPFGLAAGQVWPIWKTGHIASDPDLDYAGQPVFLIDATTRSGMSGSPVIRRAHGGYRARDGSYALGVDGTRFLGVYSGRIHGDSEIGRVWRPFLVNEILTRVP